MSNSFHLVPLKRIVGAVGATSIGIIAVSFPHFTSLALLLSGALLVLALLNPISALFVVLMLAPMRTLIATESAEALPLEIGLLTFLVFAVAYLLYRRRAIAVPKGFSPLMWAVVALLVATGISGFVASSPSAWLAEWLKWWAILAILWVTSQLSQQAWRWLAVALMLSASANAVVGIYIFLGGSGADHLLIEGRYFRAFGTFGQPNPFGGFMGMSFPFAAMTSLAGLHIMLRIRALSGRVVPSIALASAFAFTAMLVLFAGLIASWSRGAWLGIALATVVMLLALPRQLWRGLWLALIAMLILGGLWLGGLLPASITERITSSASELLAFSDVRGVDITAENYAVIERFAHWQAALNMVQDHPWLGIGLGNYDVVYEQFRLINWPFALGHAHNYYLNILAEAGMIGLLAYLGLGLVTFYLAWKTRRHPDLLSRYVGIACIGSITYLAVHSLFDNLYVNNLFIHIGVIFSCINMLQATLDV